MIELFGVILMSSVNGPIVFDLIGQELTVEEQELLQHPLIGGVILFSRNFESPEQITQLCLNIRHSRQKPILITVDQEGGRVQRFRNGFTRLPSMGEIGKLYDKSPQAGLNLAATCGWLMAIEVLSVGVDLSFAPILDLDKGICPVIGDRAFHHDPAIVIQLAQAFTQGMRDAGMRAVGKHFPGHGSVDVDSHLGSPVDQRQLSEIVANDLIPFAAMIASGIEGLMPAHIVFPEVDEMPVGFSPIWLNDILRQQLKFKGMIFSDALDMAGAKLAGNYLGRTQAALQAGCDMALICNNRAGVIEVLDGLAIEGYMVSGQKIDMMRGNFSQVPSGLKKSKTWQEKYHVLEEMFNESMQ